MLIESLSTLLKGTVLLAAALLIVGAVAVVLDVLLLKLKERRHVSSPVVHLLAWTLVVLLAMDCVLLLVLAAQHALETGPTLLDAAPPAAKPSTCTRVIRILGCTAHGAVPLR